MHVIYEPPVIICFQSEHFVYQPILNIYACTGVYLIMLLNNVMAFILSLK